MRYALICVDKAGALQTRLDTRAAHLDYIAATGVVEMAGPLFDDAGAMSGSLLILTVADRAAAQGWANGDPYAIAGLFQSVEIHAWKKLIG